MVAVGRRWAGHSRQPTIAGRLTRSVSGGFENFQWHIATLHTPPVVLLETAQRVVAWAVATDAGQDDPLLMSVVSAARALVDAIHASGRDAFSQLLIEAMVDQAIADGTSDPKHSAEAGGLTVTESTGSNLGPGQADP